jgi:predicted DNA-binding transcriptional regulator YafY
MRADRLLSIMLLLQVYRRVTAGELAKRLEVSERTIYRDVEALSTAGIPVIAERGTGGGLTLLDSYRVSLNGLKPPEIQTLFLGKPSRLLADLGLEDAAENALLKLLAALPSVYRNDAEFIRQRIYIDSARWHQNPEDLTWLPALQAALWQDRKVVIQYQRGDEESVERRVDPLGLVSKGVLWYLIAGVGEDVRTYRVSRIQNVTITDEPCSRPADFDLAAFWQQSSVEFVQNLPRFPVTVRALPDGLTQLLRASWSKIERVDPPDADGWQGVEMVFDAEEVALYALAGTGATVEIIAPESLRAKLIEHVQRVVALYQPSLTSQSSA